MRRSSLDTIDVGIDRELSNQFDAVKLVAGSIEDVERVSSAIEDGSLEAANNIAGPIQAIGANIVEVTAVGANIDDVAAVAGDLNNVDIVATNIANVNAVGPISADVSAVASEIAAVAAVADVNNMADIKRVADDLNAIDDNMRADITIVAGDLSLGVDSNVVAVSQNIDDVVIVANDMADVTVVRSNINSVVVSSDNIGNIVVVATDLTMAGWSSLLDAGSIIEDVESKPTGISLIETVATNMTEVVLVSDNIDDVITVAGSVNAIETNAVNIVDIQNAEGNAASALSSANIASAKASEASVSASTASTQAGIATTKASEASASAASALVYQNAASISADNALTSANNADVSEANALTSASAAAVKANEALVSANTAITQAEIATIKAVEASESAANALTSENGALSSKNSAAISASTATTKAAEAVISASSSAGSASAAATKANDASLSAASALASENKAEKWADEAEDVEVEAGKYSAKHWASKAAKIVVAGLIDDVSPSTFTVFSSTRSNNTYEPKNSNIQGHISNNTTNPHNVTKSQVGLSNVDNTSDVDKPVSSAQATAIGLKQDALISGTNIKTINGNSIVGSGNISTIQTSVSGNAGTATKLETLRSIAITGDASGSANFDGSANANIAITLNSDVTKEGNTFNGISQLVKTETDGKLPAIDGSKLTGINALPSQTGFGGKYLKTNGTVATWEVSDVYTHPTNHSPSIITQDSNNRFVSDAEKTTWNNKLDKSGGTMTGAITAIRETQISLGASSAIDLSLGNLFTKSINSSTTFSVLNCLSSGTSNSFILELVNAGAFTITWFSGIKWAKGIAPVLTASGVDVLGFYSYDGGVTWKGLVLGNDMK